MLRVLTAALVLASLLGGCASQTHSTALGSQYALFEKARNYNDFWHPKRPVNCYQASSAPRALYQIPAPVSPN